MKDKKKMHQFVLFFSQKEKPTYNFAFVNYLLHATFY